MQDFIVRNIATELIESNDNKNEFEAIVFSCFS